MPFSTRFLTVVLCLHSSPILATPNTSTATGPQTTQSYAETRAALERKRSDLAKQWRTADESKARRAILDQTAELFAEAVAEDLTPHWFGTGWDFNGTSVEPGSGHIACGYFVSTLLQHTGLKISRVRVGQMASQRIIRHLIGSKQRMPILVGAKLPIFLKKVRSMGPGLYVVGLDRHVGFLHVRKAAASEKLEVRFLHSNFVKRHGVVDELADTSAVLAASNYRVVGKLTESDPLLKRWLLGR